MPDISSAPPYFDYQLASAFMTPQVLEAVLDDANQGPGPNQTLNPGAMLVFNLLANLACTRVDGFLKRVYPGPFPLAPNLITVPPGNVPANVQTAALFWFKTLCFERHTEYVKQYGTGPRKEAMTFCEDLCDSKEWLADLPGGNPPGNAGGIITNCDPRIIVDAADGSNRSGDF